MAYELIFMNFTKSKGFTLLEIMVVLLIMGVLIGTIGFSMGTRHRHLETESERLTALLKLVQQEAMLTSSRYAAEFHAGGYRFQRWQGEQASVVGEGVYRPRQLDHDFRLALRFPEEDGGAVTLPEGADKDELPGIHFFAGGEITPFELTVSVESTEQRYRITGGFLGDIEMELVP